MNHTHEIEKLKERLEKLEKLVNFLGKHTDAPTVGIRTLKSKPLKGSGMDANTDPRKFFE